MKQSELAKRLNVADDDAAILKALDTLEANAGRVPGLEAEIKTLKTSMAQMEEIELEPVPKYKVGDMVVVGEKRCEVKEVSALGFAYYLSMDEQMYWLPEVQIEGMAPAEEPVSPEAAAAAAKIADLEAKVAAFEAEKAAAAKAELDAEITAALTGCAKGAVALLEPQIREAVSAGKTVVDATADLKAMVPALFPPVKQPQAKIPRMSGTADNGQEHGSANKRDREAMNKARLERAK